MNILVLDSVHSQAADKTTKDLLAPVLSFEEIFQKMGPRGPIRKSKRISLINKKGIFPTGLLPRVTALARAKSMPLTIELYPDAIVKLDSPNNPVLLDNVVYRDYQIEAIKAVIHHQRGVIQAPARSGKTVIGAGIIRTFKSTHPNLKALFVVNTKDIFYQTVEEFQKFGLSPGRLGDGFKEIDNDVTVAIFQSLKTRANLDFMCQYDLIIVDEAHHARNIDGVYWKVLMNSLALIKIGLTATIPDKEGHKMIMEGLLGPVIYEVSQKKAKEIGATVKAKVKIIKAPEAVMHIKTMSYMDAYHTGIINNRSLSRLLIKTAVGYLEQGQTVLILVSRVQHGMNLEKMFNLLYPQYEVPFLCGGIDSETKAELEHLKNKLAAAESVNTPNQKLISELDSKICQIKEIERDVKEKSRNRNQYRHKFINKEIPCIIATGIWNEGVNIPTLNVLINAAGGKSEIKTIQGSSRSLTAASGKQEGLIIDIFNPLHRAFIEHFGHRISTYCDLGWM